MTTKYVCNPLGYSDLKVQVTYCGKHLIHVKVNKAKVVKHCSNKAICPIDKKIRKQVCLEGQKLL